ncbi:MAG: hypothetical protein ACPGVG_17595 [Mycobacterium sp.]
MRDTMTVSRTRLYGDDSDLEARVDRAYLDGQRVKAIRYLGNQWRGRAGAAHRYKNSLGQWTEAKR